MGITDKGVVCPHCGHHIHLLLDGSNGDQEYYEDCPACCNAIHVNFHVDEVTDNVDLNLAAE